MIIFFYFYPNAYTNKTDNSKLHFFLFHHHFSYSYSHIPIFFYFLLFLPFFPFFSLLFSSFNSAMREAKCFECFSLSRIFAFNNLLSAVSLNDISLLRSANPLRSNRLWADAINAHFEAKKRSNSWRALFTSGSDSSSSSSSSSTSVWCCCSSNDDDADVISL